MFDGVACEDIVVVVVLAPLVGRCEGSEEEGIVAVVCLCDCVYMTVVYASP